MNEWLQIVIIIALFALRIFLSAWIRTRNQRKEAQAKNKASSSEEAHQEIGTPSSFNPILQYSAATHITKVAHDYYQTVMSISPTHQNQDDKMYNEKRFDEIHDYFNNTLSENTLMFPEQAAIIKQTKLMRSITYSDIKNNTRKEFGVEYSELVKILTPYLER